MTSVLIAMLCVWCARLLWDITVLDHRVGHLENKP